MLYPTLEHMFTSKDNGLFKKYPPVEIWTDYTNEKAFSEYLETSFYPSFANPHSKNYKNWKMVHPVISSQPVNLQMKQNAAQMMQEDANGFRVFEWPDLKRTRPETGIIIAEAKEQTLREAAHSMKSGAGMTKAVFPKPVGYDNDLIRALELALLGARKYAKSVSHLDGKVEIRGAGLREPAEENKVAKFNRTIQKRLANFNITEIDTKFPKINKSFFKEIDN